MVRRSMHHGLIAAMLALSASCAGTQNRAPVNASPAAVDVKAAAAAGAFMQARWSRDDTPALRYVTADAAAVFEGHDGIALVQTSNPYPARWNLIEAAQLAPTKARFVVRVFQAYTGYGEVGHHDETLTLETLGKSQDERWFITGAALGEYVDYGRLGRPNAGGDIQGDATVQASMERRPSSMTEAGLEDAVHVRTSDELVEAIAPGRTILLAPGRYHLDGAGDSPYLTRKIDGQYRYFGAEVTLHDVDDLTIVGSADGISEIVCDSQYQDVLRVKNVSRLRLSRLTFGHVVDEECSGSVLVFGDSNEVMIDHCDIYGSGAIGLVLENIHGLALLDSVIRDCTYGILGADASSRLVLRGNCFRGTRGSAGIELERVSDFLAEDCEIAGNTINGKLFVVASSTGVVVRDSRIFGNRAWALDEGPGIAFSTTEIHDNEFGDSAVGDFDETERQVSPPPNQALPSPELPATHVVREGDSLWTISRQYYGSGRYWKRIEEVNPALQDRHVEEGETLTIPPLQERP